MPTTLGGFLHAKTISVSASTSAARYCEVSEEEIFLLTSRRTKCPCKQADNIRVEMKLAFDLERT